MTIGFYTALLFRRKKKKAIIHTLKMTTFMLNMSDALYCRWQLRETGK